MIRVEVMQYWLVMYVLERKEVYFLKGARWLGLHL